jgi:iron complex transport system substrate-binding protein
MHENEIARIIVDSAIGVHRDLGPGLLESVYEVVLAKRLRDRGLAVERQHPIPFVVDGIAFEEGFRADLFVEQKLIIEIKSVLELNAVHAKQLLTYLRLSHCKLGLLINFGAGVLKDGIKRVINGSLDESSVVPL